MPAANGVPTQFASINAVFSVVPAANGAPTQFASINAVFSVVPAANEPETRTTVCSRCEQVYSDGQLL